MNGGWKIEERRAFYRMVSGVNDRGEPFVQMAQTRDGKRLLLGQMTPSEARSLALQGLEAAEAAETDAFIWGYFTSKMDLKPAAIAALIADFRDFRAKMGSSLPTTMEHWNAVMDEMAKEKTGKPFDPTKKQ